MNRRRAEYQKSARFWHVGRWGSLLHHFPLSSLSSDQHYSRLSSVHCHRFTKAQIEYEATTLTLEYEARDHLPVKYLRWHTSTYAPKMPRPTFPPTPGSSTDIKGKEGPQLGSLQVAFELPPPAMANTESRPSSASTKSSSASSYHPTSPKSPIFEKKTSIAPARRRSSAEKATTKDAFTLPPPPTRSRKIIQMKPRGQAEGKLEDEVNDTREEPSKASGTQNKRKQPSATSVAGRKIARKTAHSLIERRRRSKMNEEFGVLKDMIPACTGEMHKLAILQVRPKLHFPLETTTNYAGLYRLRSLPRRLRFEAQGAKQSSHTNSGFWI